MELYVILELTKDGELFNCDNKLNRIGEYDESWANYFLMTKDEIETIKERLGDKAITLRDECEEFISEKYHILSADDIIAQCEEESGWNEELEMWNDWCGDGDFIEAMGDNFNEDVKHCALEKSRILKDFIDAEDEVCKERYKKWKMENR